MKKGHIAYLSGLGEIQRVIQRLSPNGVYKPALMSVI